MNAMITHRNPKSVLIVVLLGTALFASVMAVLAQGPEPHAPNNLSRQSIYAWRRIDVRTE